MFRFNRFYLLFALVFSYVIPFLKINLPAVSQKENQLVFDEIQTQQLIQNTNQTSQFDWLNLILSTFVLVSIFMIIKSKQLKSLFSFIARALFTVLYYVDVSLFCDYIGLKKLFLLFLYLSTLLKTLLY